jgi:hypothetical protein
MYPRLHVPADDATGNPTGNRYSAHHAEYRPVRQATQLLLFDPGTRYEIRTPRRGDAYQSQLWAQSGYWNAGVFPTREEARRAARQLAADEPAPPAPGEVGPANWVKRRRRYDEDAPRWVRRVKGGAYQARYWLEVVGGSLNLGLFTLAEHPDDPGSPQGEMARWAAARAAEAFRRLWYGDRTVLEAVEILQRKRPLPADWPRKWKLRTPWVPETVVVPEKWRSLTLPPESGEERKEREGLERHSRRYQLGTLVTLLEADRCEIAA